MAATNEGLDAAIQAFREAEMRLKELADRAQELESAGSRLDAAHKDMALVRADVQSMADQLSGLAAELATATAALKSSDPEAVLRETARVADQVERLRSKADEIGAEQRTRAEAIARRQAEDLSALKDDFGGAMRTGKRLALATLGLVVVATSLIIWLIASG